MMDHFSVTQTQMILKCPVQWWFRYKLGIKSPPGWAMVGGIALDETINYHNELRIGGSTDPYLEDYYSQTLTRVSEEKQPEGEIDYDYKGLGPYAVREYLRVADPILFPRAVQVEISTDWNGVPFLGYIDLEDGKEHKIINDLKFSKRKQLASTSLQMHSYDATNGEEPHMTRIITVVKNKKPKVEFDTHFVATQDRAAAERTVHSAYRLAMLALERDDPSILTMSNPDNWWCGDKWCGYWSQCRGSARGIPSFEEEE